MKENRSFTSLLQLARNKKGKIDYKPLFQNYLNIAEKSQLKAKKGAAILASLPGRRYPYVYPRDAASTSRVLSKLCVKEDFCSRAFPLLRDLATFILFCQREDGYWGQRYNLNLREKSIYKQEDNVAHGIEVICNYALTASKIGEPVVYKDRIVKALSKAVDFAMKNYYRQEMDLFFSTTSIHESAIEKGYTIWVNFSYLSSFSLAVEFLESEGEEKEVEKIQHILERFKNNIFKSFKLETGYIRRYTPTGDIDFRPDITLFSPFYFGFESPEDKIMLKTIDFISHHLWDPILGGLQRYLPFTEDLNTHIHAGNGPWMVYTAILARYYYATGHIEKGDVILRLIDNYRSPEGYIPEHLSTRERFQEFMRLEWNTGLDYAKEFSPDILLPGIPFNRIVEELNHMRKSYSRISRWCSQNPEAKFIRFCCPLLWAHSEYTQALLEREKMEKRCGEK